MARKILYVVAFTGLSLAVLAYAITRPGELVTPTGSGTVTIDGQTFEAFPLPDYVTSIAGGDYLSYLIEVEPGIKIHMLEVGRASRFSYSTATPRLDSFIARWLMRLGLNNSASSCRPLQGSAFRARFPRTNIRSRTTFAGSIKRSLNSK